MDNDFVHLHVHTEYSLLDGANRINRLMDRASEYGMKSIAITDHGVMYGVIDFYKQARKKGIKPIIGCEVYTAKRSRFDRQSGIDSDQGHLVLLAKNNTGYKNLMKIVTFGFTEGFYYKPRIDVNLLKQYSEGLIALSACLAGDIPAALIAGDYERAREIAITYKSIFGDGNFYIELQINGIEEQVLANQQLIKLAKELEIPLVATNDVHYLNRSDAAAHDVLLCIQTGKKRNDEDRLRFSTQEVFFKTQEEMSRLFENIPEAIENTRIIADNCNVNIEFEKVKLPEFKTPDGSESGEYLRKLCFEGLKKRYGEEISSERQSRLEYELSVIHQMGYDDYYLIVWDFVNFAVSQGIIVGPGRGSGAGSFAAYCLGITNIDSLKYNLLFERFLNPERVSMPDFDIDFCDTRRQEVIDYVVSKYGKDRVAQIISFGSMKARAVIRDVGRALDIPYSDVDQVAKMVPFQLDISIDKALEINSELMQRYKNDPIVKELIDTARILEGMPRHASTHAAGVVVSRDAIVEHVPLQLNEESITTQFEMVTLDELGLLKVDFLGLRTLTVIKDAIDLIKDNYRVDVDFDHNGMDDPEVFKMIGEGKTSGVFQLESPGMTQFFRELKPVSLEEIIAGNSLYRPGPMDQIPKYLKNRNNPSEIKYATPLLEKILDVTYGCMVYQEQVMQIVRELAGYSMGRADIVRRAMSKKKVDVMEQERKNFIYGIVADDGNIIVKGAVQNGVDEATANQIFDEMMDFASYAFNKSHAAAYAVLTYQTAWLKRYYPVEFMAATLNSYLASSDKVSQYVHECRSVGISVLPPDINESQVKFSVKDGRIRFGLAAVKNVGIGAVTGIIKERRENGSFKNFREFCERMDGGDLNKRCIESLIKCGTFDSFGIFRSRFMAAFEKMIDGIQQNRKRNFSGQLTLFGSNDLSDEKYPELKEYPPKMLLTMEKEMLGLYISGHPLSEYENDLKSYVTLYSSDTKTESQADDEQSAGPSSSTLEDGSYVVIGGIVAGKKVKTTKNNNVMAFITLEDLYGTMEVIVFPTVFTKYAELLNEENIVIIRGRISIKEEEELKIICEEVAPLKNNEVKTETTKLYLKIDLEKNARIYKSITSMLRFFNGNTPVCIYNESENTLKTLDKQYWVHLNDLVLIELRQRLGEGNVKLKSAG